MSSNVIAYTIDKAINNSLYISVENGEVVVKAPWYYTRNKIQEIVEEKRNWIIKKLKEYENTPSDYANTIQVLGKTYNLKVAYKNIDKIQCNMHEKVVEFVLPMKYKKQNNVEKINNLIEKLYIEIAQKEIEGIMEKTRKMVGFTPEDYTLINLKNILAKCNHQEQKIIINPNIVRYNKEIIEHIILHEYCHLKFKNHTKSFYDFLAKYEPNYQKFEELKLNY